MKCLCGLMLALSLITWSYDARSEPGKSTDWLIREPVSLMDLGIQRLDHLMSDSIKNLDKYKKGSWQINYQASSGSATYQIKTDMILLSFILNFKREQTLDKELCADVWQAGQKAVLQNGILMGWSPNKPADMLLWAFSHEGYEEEQQTSALYDDLVTRTNIEVILLQSGKSFYCRGNLTSKDASALTFESY